MVSATASCSTKSEGRTVIRPRHPAYSQLDLNLRTQLLVLTLPKVDQGRYFSVSCIDQYTDDYALLGSRTTGNGGVRYLIAGPGWKGDELAGVDEVITSSTELRRCVQDRDGLY